ncbi:MAG: helix-turn-helix domain-containing protein [Alphaproteobacteria bacterium]|nr:helix-turn-helix domain-containing protein [Alphaproteobacteria bacterium]
MSSRNALLTSPPFEVEQALKTLGQNLRTARLRRNLSLEDIAAKVGVGRHVVGAAERGKPSTGIAVYVAMLWALGLTDQLTGVADPLSDEEGLLLANRRERVRAHPRKGLSNDF